MKRLICVLYSAVRCCCAAAFSVSRHTQAGVVKMNVDTDTQWTYWEGVKNFYQVN